MRRWLLKSVVKAHSLTVEGRWKLGSLNAEEVSGIPCVAVKCIDIWRNTSGEGGLLTIPDAETRKCGEQTGLDTLVVHALNYEY